MRLLLTGSAGYAGRGIGQVLSTKHWVRGMDVRPSGPELQDAVVGDVGDLATCAAALEGIEAVVLCHMAPNPAGYKTPPAAIDINVKGTANLYHIMAERAIKRAVLISTAGVLRKPPLPPALPGDGPYNLGQDPKQTLYGLTKVMQEMMACYYYETAGIVTTMLRPSWIVYDEKLITKYGEKMEDYNSGLIDPRDIGEAILAALSLADPKVEAFPLMQDDADVDLSAVQQRLGWHAKFKFATLKRS